MKSTRDINTKEFKILLIKAGKRQREVAADMDIHVTTLSAILSGRINPSDKELEKLLAMAGKLEKEIQDIGDCDGAA